MKKILLSSLLVALFSASFAQAPIDRILTRAAITEPSENLYKDLIPVFKKCLVNGDDAIWLKNYFTAFSYLQLANVTSNKDTIKTLLNEASRYLVIDESLINKQKNANAIKSDYKCLNILFHAIELKGMLNPAQSPEMRKIKLYLEEAKKLNDKNPRVDYVRAVSLLNQTNATNEDKKLAKSLLENTIKFFTENANAEKAVDNASMIQWGLNESQYLLNTLN